MKRRRTGCLGLPQATQLERGRAATATPDLQVTCCLPLTRYRPTYLLRTTYLPRTTYPARPVQPLDASAQRLVVNGADADGILQHRRGYESNIVRRGDLVRVGVRVRLRRADLVRVGVRVRRGELAAAQ